jgi:hypothetical protein
MLQLEILIIRFGSNFINRVLQRQPLHTPSITQVTLPNLRRFAFLGTATYLDGLVDRISAPSLSSLSVDLYGETPVTVPHLLHFLQSSENLRFNAVKAAFSALYSGHLSAGTPRFPCLELHILCPLLTGRQRPRRISSMHFHPYFLS